MDITKAYLQTLDYQNDVFRSIMLNLSRQQQKIVSFLAEEQGAVNVKIIAQKLFLTHQTTSSQLKHLLEKEILDKHSMGRESYYEIADIHFRHWLDLKARRVHRITNWVKFVQIFYDGSTLIEKHLNNLTSNQNQDKEMLKAIASFDPNNITTEKEKELDKFLEYWFIANEIREQKNK